MFQIESTSRVPIYEQLINNVIKLASLGIIKPDDRLPPVRVLASQLGINPNTVAKAYRDLESRGYIYSTVGRGSFLSNKLSENTAQRHLAVENFQKACANAVTYGVTREELIEIVDDACKGGQSID